MGSPLFREFGEGDHYGGLCRNLKYKRKRACKKKPVRECSHFPISLRLLLGLQG